MACKHPETEFVGEQKTDDGVNVFRRCRACGEVLVVTPEHKVIGIQGTNEHDN